MKKVKFRAWEPNNRTMIIGSSIKMRPIFDNPCLSEQAENLNYELMLFSGFHDSTLFEDLSEDEKSDWLDFNKKEDWKGYEIYEGDIVKVFEPIFDEIKEWIAEVSFRNAAFVLVNKSCYDICKNSTGYICYLGETPGKIKIIGNIYENAELLKQQ